MKTDFLKVVYIMSSPPAYELYHNTPIHNIFKDDRADVSKWRGDWADQIGRNVTKLDRNIIFEVWQPDLKADRIYSADISDKVCHKLFPACIKKNILKTYYYSDKLLEAVNNIKEGVIFQMGYLEKYHYDIINKIKPDNKIIGTLHGEFTTYSQKIFKLRKNQLSTLSHICDYFMFKKNINRYNVLTYLSDVNINNLKKLYRGKLCKINMGIDTSFYKKMDKLLCRKELNLNFDKKIILSVGRLNFAKQSHKLINILSELSDNFDFLAVFIGHGEKEYENYLKKISDKLLKKNQIIFTGHLAPELLVKYYNSADLLFMSSESEGVPVVSMEALACEIPVISTDTGNVAELIKEQTVNNIVGRYDYLNWKLALTGFLQGNEIEKINIELVRRKYSWESAADEFIEIYRSI